ncbi:MAG: hypothetical protein LBC02_02500, partial [Planctomycetaceae bacterium]|nr:hypothetical protein [Planctomycetaceae bacterium]
MKHTNRPPFIFRLMLLSVFLPIFIVVGEFWVYTITDKTSPFWNDQSLLNSISISWFFLFLITLPLLVGILIFLSGRWRLPFFVAGTIYCCSFLLMIFGDLNLKVCTPEAKRFIHWDANTNIPAGTDVYCNGVYLGQIPLKIPMNEFIAKVPEWTSPPEQRFYERETVLYEGETVPNYTWFPWDDFRKERFLKTKELLNSKIQSETFSPADKKELSAKYESDCRYWWRLEKDKSQLLLQKSFSIAYHLYYSYERVDRYYINTDNAFSPSAVIHAWLLVNVLEELTESEKNEWDKHVLKHWSLLSAPLANALACADHKYRSKNMANPRVKLFETALDSVARLKYGLSNPPTEEECRQLLTNWVNQSIENQQPFSIRSCYSKLTDVFDNSLVRVANDEAPLIDAAIKLMGEAVRKPLAEQWKTNYYRYENGWAPLLYVSEKDCGKEYFNNMVCYFATTYNGKTELLKNQNEQVIPLFRTILYRKNFLDFVKPDAKRYQQSIINSII